MKPTAVAGRRVAAFILDGLINTAVNAALFFPLADTSEELVRKVTNGELDPNTTTYVNLTIGDTQYSILGSKAGLYFLITFAFSFFYWVVLPGIRGYTPGKAAVGLRIVKDDGTMPIGVMRSFTRQILWIADAFPYLIPYLTGFLLAKFHPRNKRIGDMVAGTLVVRKEFAEGGGGGGGFGTLSEPDHQFQQDQGAVTAPAPSGPAQTPTMAIAAVPKPAPQAPPTSPPADWYPDPKGEKRLRYWDGAAWTDHVAD
jgi:uncharacterized RDD family membrane protein YckC